ncbi:MAG TPA: ABC transporter permease [Euzebya sp.]|nr:ABC transporter permease [Euzebya sp.]
MNFWEYLTSNYPALLEQSVQHVRLVVSSVSAAIVIGVALGILAHRSPVARASILTVTSTLLTIPSLAFFALLIPFVGIGNRAPTVALAAYALLPIVRNTVSGLQSVDRAIVESAKGMGMGGWRRLWIIELPIAWPVILTGIRVATLLNVGIAAIAVLVGGDGLGREIFRGIRSLGSPFAPNLVFGGTLFIVLIAVLFDLFFSLLSRITTSRGIR